MIAVDNKANGWDLEELVDSAIQNTEAGSSQSRPVAHPDELLTQQQVMRLLGVSKQTVIRWTKQGELVHKYIGKKPYYSKLALYSFSGKPRDFAPARKTGANTQRIPRVPVNKAPLLTPKQREQAFHSNLKRSNPVGTSRTLPSYRAIVAARDRMHIYEGGS
jgi:hypothetical protein